MAAPIDGLRLVALLEFGQTGSMPRSKPRVGLALGGGAARGWAHVGAIRALRFDPVNRGLFLLDGVGKHQLARCDEREHRFIRGRIDARILVLGEHFFPNRIGALLGR